MLQLEKTYGRNKDAKLFIQELIRGVLSINLPLRATNIVSKTQRVVINHKSFPFNDISIGPEAKRAPHTLRPGMVSTTGDSCGSRCWLLPHRHLWEAPNCEKARMYKVLKEILEETMNGRKTTTSVPGIGFKLWYVFPIVRWCPLCTPL